MARSSWLLGLGTADYLRLVSTVQPPRALAAGVEQGWIGDQPSVTITTPDLSKLPRLAA